MVTGPWDPMRAVAPGRFLASDADRERVVDILKTAFVHGLLTKDELGTRTGQALTARTYAELAGITTGITGLTARPAESRAPRKRVNKRVVAWSACGIALPPSLVAVFFTFYGGFLVLLLCAFLGVVLSSPGPRRPGPAPISGRH